MRAIRYVLPATLLALTACSHQNSISPQDIRPLPYSNLTRVGGIRAALKRSPEHPVRVLVLHGMITDNQGYSNRLQTSIVQKLGMALRASADPAMPIERGYDPVLFFGPQPFDGRLVFHPSKIQRTAWRDGNNMERLIFYEVLWAPLRDAAKNEFLACFEARWGQDARDCRPMSGRNTDSRALANGLIKDFLFIKGLADAAVALGGVGNVLRDDLSLAMCLVARDTLGVNRTGRCDLAADVVARPDLMNGTGQQDVTTRLSTTEFFAITHSLGSYLLLSQQREYVLLSNPNTDDVNELLGEMLAFSLLDDATVFMRANQVSLLQLAEFEVHCTREPCPARNITALPENLEHMPHNAATAMMTTYVAFNDVNDILGFELPPYLSEVGPARFVNVSVRNPARRLPWVLKGPLGTHTNSDRDSTAVIDGIVEGFAIPKQ